METQPQKVAGRSYSGEECSINTKITREHIDTDITNNMMP
jgi:hypothetical protein